MNIEDDEYCTADYGVFGDRSCTCSICRPPIPKRDIAQEKRDAAWQRRMDREREASRSFNSHMIDLYNSARKE